MQKDVIKIYCDGGCRGNQKKNNIGGWGAVLLYKDKKKEIKGGEYNTTNNKMELIACIKALELIKTNLPIEIYTDSAYLYNCMTQKWYKKWQKNGWKTSQKKSVENKELWLKLINFIEKYNIKFIKVKGHNGIEYNERADELANLAMDELKK